MTLLLSVKVINIIKYIQLTKVGFVCEKTSHKGISSFISVVVEERQGTAQFSVVLLNKPSSRHS